MQKDVHIYTRTHSILPPLRGQTMKHLHPKSQVFIKFVPLVIKCPGIYNPHPTLAMWPDVSSTSWSAWDTYTVPTMALCALHSSGAPPSAGLAPGAWPCSVPQLLLPSPWPALWPSSPFRPQHCARLNCCCIAEITVLLAASPHKKQETEENKTFFGYQSALSFKSSRSEFLGYKESKTPPQERRRDLVSRGHISGWLMMRKSLTWENHWENQWENQ